MTSKIHAEISDNIRYANQKATTIKVYFGEAADKTYTYLISKNDADKIAQRMKDQPEGTTLVIVPTSTRGLSIARVFEIDATPDLQMGSRLKWIETIGGMESDTESVRKEEFQAIDMMVRGYAKRMKVNALSAYAQHLPSD